MMKQHKAIALFSGGLDSLLAVKWMESRGYTVYPVYFSAPYLKAERALKSAQDNGINLRVIDFFEAHYKVVKNPVWGRGKGLNPCVDCHALMFQMAAELLPEYGASFLISGEVLGQRPMSQTKNAMAKVSAMSSVRDLIVRPLSQALLSDTNPIKEGWVDREDLLSINGRSREAQYALAKKLGVHSFPAPAGGCLLTDRNYCLRLSDLMKHGQDDRENMDLLLFGRHFRINDLMKLIIGRTEEDNKFLLEHCQHGLVLDARNCTGPLGIITGSNPSEGVIDLALGIFLFYNSKAQDTDEVLIHDIDNNNNYTYVAKKLDKETIRKYHISND